MNNTNKPIGGGVVIAQNLKKTSVILTKDGQEIKVNSPQERNQVIKQLLRR